MLLKTLAVAAMAVNVVIVNARVWTGDARRPWADAVAVEGDRIRAVGSSAEIMKLAAGARVIDAHGAMVVPGFTDTHVHFIDGGFRLPPGQLRDGRTRLRSDTGDLGKQQLGLLGMVQALGKLVDIEQHRAQHLEILLARVTRAALDHHDQRTQHRRQGGMFVTDDADALVCHRDTP